MGAPSPYSPLEWTACVIENLIPSISTVPPLFMPSCPASGNPSPSSQLASSIIATSFGENRLPRSTAPPMWSPWPWVSAITSMRSGSASLSGHFGFASHGSTYTRFPPGVSTRQLPWPNHVSSTSGIRRSFSRDEYLAGAVRRGREALEPGMATRALPVGLLLFTLVMDGQGLHQTAFYVLVLAVAAAVAGALSAFGDLV